MNSAVVNVVKIGGNVIDNPEALDKFLDDFVKIPTLKILVHGGGKIATAMAAKLGVETMMIDGRRVTSPAMLDVALMVYAGLINKKIVAGLQKRGCNAIGLCGADGMSVEARKRSPKPIDYGQVGDVVAVNQWVIDKLLKAELTPVFCAISCDFDGNLLNTNADTMATEIAQGLTELRDTRLTFCFEKRGVLADVDNPDSVIESIDRQSFAELKENGTINSGMLPKIENALKAVAQGVESVTIKSSEELLSESGTVIVR